VYILLNYSKKYQLFQYRTQIIFQYLFLSCLIFIASILVFIRSSIIRVHVIHSLIIIISVYYVTITQILLQLLLNSTLCLKSSSLDIIKSLSYYDILQVFLFYLQLTLSLIDDYVFTLCFILYLIYLWLDLY
jgi:hypothetical protein